MPERIGQAPQLANGTRIPLSPAVRSGNLLFVSGQLGLTKSGALCSELADEQTRQTLANIQGILDSVGITLAQVIKATIWITDKNDFPAINQVWAEVFGDYPPARSTVVSELLIPSAKIEVEVVAEVD